MANTTSFAAAPPPGLRKALRHALRPTILARSVAAGAIMWLIMGSVSPSYSSLIFQDELAVYFAAGLGIALVSNIVVVVLTSLFTSDHTTISQPQSTAAIFHGLIVGAVVAAAPADTPPETLFALAVWSVVLSSLLAGGVVLLLGMLRAGSLIRYVPFPIIGGYMAGLGWILLQAGFKVVVGLRIGVETLPLLTTGELFLRWLPALVFGAVVLGMQTRSRSVFIVPGAVAVSLVLFNLGALVAGDGVDGLIEAGWLLPRVPDSIHWQLPDISALGHFNLEMILASLGGIATLIVVCTLELFFRVSGQELVIGREVNFNREFTVNGASNIASSAVGGGIAGYPIPSYPLLIENLGAYGRLAGFVLALMFGLMMLFGGSVYTLVPRFLPAGLLMYFGLRYMKEWLIDSRSFLPPRDYLIVGIIALVTALVGFLPGIAIGLMMAMAFFVLEYSRLDVIKQEFSASSHRSNLERSFAQNRLLQEEGRKVLIFRLQGFVFFGTTYHFHEHVRARITDEKAEPLRFLILDFQSVSGFDVSTVHDFRKLKGLADRSGVELLICNPLPQLRPLLTELAVAAHRSNESLLFDDLDHALEWCENILLAEAGLRDTRGVTVEEQLAHHRAISADEVRALHRYFERMESRVGDTIFRPGDEPDAFYFIESGRVDILLRGEAGQELRLRSMTAGTIVGEVGFYLNKVRSVSIAVTEAGVLHRLDKEALRRMGEDHPQLAAAIQVLITRVLSDRLSNTNRLIEELMG